MTEIKPHACGVDDIACAAISTRGHAWAAWMMAPVLRPRSLFLFSVWVSSAKRYWVILAKRRSSVPNASFAGINLENYSVRDKILFNPKIQIKRATPKDQIRRAMASIQEALAKNKMVELGPTPVRISSLTADSFAMEIFAYVLTADMDEFYKVEAELFLMIDDVLSSAGAELA